MKTKEPNLQNAWISEQLLDLITARATSRILLCAMLSISQPTLKNLLEYHHYKEWQIDLLSRRLKLSKPACQHKPFLMGNQMICETCNEPIWP